MSHPVEPPTRVRTVHFRMPPPDEVANRCTNDAAALLAARDELEADGVLLTRTVKEAIRGAAASLALAATCLHGAVSDPTPPRDNDPGRYVTEGDIAELKQEAARRRGAMCEYCGLPGTHTTPTACRDARAVSDG